MKVEKTDELVDVGYRLDLAVNYLSGLALQLSKNEDMFVLWSLRQEKGLDILMENLHYASDHLENIANSEVSE